MKKPMLYGWGRVGTPALEYFSENLEHITQNVPLSRGLGRSYGDSSLPTLRDPRVANSTLADRMLSFDETTGVLTAEAGLSLLEMNRILLPRGWFTPVSPGTQYVTLGGMVASDIHGKNHHIDGCIGEHVLALKLRVADGRIVTCSRNEHADLFKATLGGMGLTGHILEVTLKMHGTSSAWIYQESQRIPNLDQFLDALKTSAQKWPMTVGWIDCVSKGSAMGRGILICGRWATKAEAPAKPPAPKRPIKIPLVFPNWVLNRWTVKLFNWLYYWKHWKKSQRAIVTPATFFYPLDALGDWNRIYGSKGFTQYQCVIPEKAGKDGVKRVLELLTSLGGASFLCVIKDCGKEGTGMLSFPMAGTSIALDIPLRGFTQDLVDRLNEQVIREGGRIYLTKDILTRPGFFRAMEPRLDNFLEVKRKWDPKGQLQSAQSDRMFSASVASDMHQKPMPKDATPTIQGLGLPTGTR